MKSCKASGDSAEEMLMLRNSTLFTSFLHAICSGGSD